MIQDLVMNITYGIVSTADLYLYLPFQAEPETRSAKSFNV